MLGFLLSLRRYMLIRATNRGRRFYGGFFCIFAWFFIGYWIINRACYFYSGLFFVTFLF